VLRQGDSGTKSFLCLTRQFSALCAGFRLQWVRTGGSARSPGYAKLKFKSVYSAAWKANPMATGKAVSEQSSEISCRGPVRGLLAHHSRAQRQPMCPRSAIRRVLLGEYTFSRAAEGVRDRKVCCQSRKTFPKTVHLAEGALATEVARRPTTSEPGLRLPESVESQWESAANLVRHIVREHLRECLGALRHVGSRLLTISTRSFERDSGPGIDSRAETSPMTSPGLMTLVPGRAWNNHEAARARTARCALVAGVHWQIGECLLVRERLSGRPNPAAFLA